MCADSLIVKYFGIGLGVSTLLGALSIASIIAALGGLGYVLFVKVPAWYENYRDEHPKPDIKKKPNIVAEFIKAKKSKFCPNLTFK